MNKSQLKTAEMLIKDAEKRLIQSIKEKEKVAIDALKLTSFPYDNDWIENHSRMRSLRKAKEAAKDKRVAENRVHNENQQKDREMWNKKVDDLWHELEKAYLKAYNKHYAPMQKVKEQAEQMRSRVREEAESKIKGLFLGSLPAELQKAVEAMPSLESLSKGIKALKKG